MNEPNFPSELNRLAGNLSDLPCGTALYEYVHWLNERLETMPKLFTEQYFSMVTETEVSAPAKRPFLTILTRTQGTRQEMLREMLTSVAAQTDPDFELIIIGHKVSEEQERSIRSILSAYSDLVPKTRYYTLSYGTRTTPLNFGFAHALGTYIAVLDDDDIVMPNYVESFHRAGEEAPGQLLHSYVLDQDWIVERTGSSAELRPCSEPIDTYCVPFHMLRQLETNLCPLMGIAFPTVYFKKYGFVFDESLSTQEDWDYMMHLAPIVGVKDIPKATAVYRKWKNTATSYTVHTGGEWAENYLHVQDKYTAIPMLIPAGHPKIWLPDRSEPVPVPTIGQLIKEKLRKGIPSPIWNLAKSMYRLIFRRD